MKKIILISGDPNSVNSEIIFKAWKKISNKIKKKVYLIANYNLIKKQFKKFKYSTKILKTNDINKNFSSNAIKILDLDLKFKNPFKVSRKSASKFIINSLNLAHNIALKKDILGIVNCAINKKLLNKKNIGVTEFLASKCKIKNNSEVMLITNNKYAVSPITTHLDIKDISKNLSSKKIISKVITINSWLKIVKKRKPRIGILGLNPHNAELSKKSEEKKIIIPAINKLKRKGININGPLVSDTVFIKDYKKYDVIIGMFHDQVITPFKTLFKFDAVNITLGLKYLRMSPDHGTAINLIKKNKANPTSLIKCLEFLGNNKK